MRWEGLISLVILVKRLKYDQSLSMTSPSDKPTPQHRNGLYKTFKHIKINDETIIDYSHLARCFVSICMEGWQCKAKPLE